LIVDGLLTMATVELWKFGRGRHASGRWAAWLAFSLGICLSLCANIAAALELGVFAVAVAACPPPLLLAVELLNRALKRHRTETASETSTETAATSKAGDGTRAVVSRAVVSDEARPPAERTAEQRIWAYYLTERARGRMPTGAVSGLDRGHEQLRPQGAAAVAARRAPSARHRRPIQPRPTTDPVGTSLHVVRRVVV
jgi:hypothetical protein